MRTVQGKNRPHSSVGWRLHLELVRLVSIGAVKMKEIMSWDAYKGLKLLSSSSDSRHYLWASFNKRLMTVSRLWQPISSIAY